MKLYDGIGAEVFGNSRVVEILDCSEVTATSYLKRMENELKIIVPVKGWAKGNISFLYDGSPPLNCTPNDRQNIRGA